MEHLDVLDCVIGHRGDQVPAGFAVEGLDWRGVAVQVARLPLAGVAAGETIEIVVALNFTGQLVKRPGRAGSGRRDIVILAEPGGRVAIQLEDGRRSSRPPAE